MIITHETVPSSEVSIEEWKAKPNPIQSAIISGQWAFKPINVALGNMYVEINPNPNIEMSDIDIG